MSTGGDLPQWMEDLRSVKRPRVMRRSQVWSQRRLGYNAMMIGALLSLWTLLVLLALEQWRLVRVGPVVELGGALVLLVAMASGLLVFFRFQVREVRRAVTAGFWFGAGLNAPVLLVLALYIMEREYGTAAKIVGFAFSFSLLLSGVCVAAWMWVRRWGEVVLIQDGTICPRCGYSLVGNQSMICPECCRTFAYVELGTTAAEFRRRSAERAAHDGSPA